LLIIEYNQLNPNGAVTLQTPPNNKLFDIASIPRVSPLLQHRKAEQAIANNTPNQQPIINLSLSNELVNVFRPHAGPAAPLPASYSNLSVLHPSRNIGPDMPLSEFCMQYSLDAGILTKFTTNGFTHVRMLRFIRIDELKEMEFHLGDIAGLKDAVERWSVPTA
jgi:hypothetical protein